MSTSLTKKNNFSVETTLRNTPVPSPGTGFSFDLFKIKEAILGKDYDLSVVFIGNHLSKKLNSTYRKKDKPTDVLSFPLSEDEGELFINLSYTHKTARAFKRKFNDHVAFLFIHGLLHLKGYEHGSRMEDKENAYCKKFSVKI